PTASGTTTPCASSKKTCGASGRISVARRAAAYAMSRSCSPSTHRSRFSPTTASCAFVPQARALQRSIARSTNSSRIIARARFRSGGLLHPTAAPVDLGARLSARGFGEVELIQGMAADLADLPSKPQLKPGVTLHQVQGRRDVDLMLELVSWRWHVPDAARAHLDRMGEHFLLGSH